MTPYSCSQLLPVITAFSIARREGENQGVLQEALTVELGHIKI